MGEQYTKIVPSSKPMANRRLRNYQIMTHFVSTDPEKSYRPSPSTGLKSRLVAASCKVNVFATFQTKRDASLGTQSLTYCNE